VSPGPDRNLRPALGVVFVTLLLDFMGYGMLIPVLPTHLETVLGADPSDQGLVISLYMIALVIALPVWGWIADRVGRRPVLIGCLLGTGVAFTLMAFTDSLLLFALARVLQGVFGASVGTAQAYVADVTSARDRTSGFGIVGAATSLGVFGGPAVGGLLAYADPALAFLLPALLAFLAMTAASFWLPESRRLRPSRGPVGPRALLRSWMPTPLLFFSSAHTPQTRIYLYLFFHIFAVFGAAEAMFPAYARGGYGWGPVEAGLFLSYLAAVTGLTQGLLLRRLSATAGEVSLVAAGLAVTGAALMLLARIPSVWLLLPVGSALALGFGLVVPVFTSLFSQACGSDEEKGEYLAHSQSMLSLGRAVGAIAGGICAARVGIDAPFLFSGIGALLALGVFFTALPFLIPRRSPSVPPLHTRPGASGS
jgi:MFS transporter, DHA1 family, tetracycline resistance protein